MSLRTALFVTSAALILLAFATAFALLALAHEGRAGAEYIVVSVRSVEAAQKLRAEIERARAAGLRAVSSADLGRGLSDFGDLVQSSEEERVLRRVRTAVGGMQAAGSVGEFATAASQAELAAEELVNINVRQAHAAEREVEKSTSRGEAWAIFGAVASSLAVFVVLVWSRNRVLKPVELLRARIRSVALGGASLPPVSSGPAELRELAEAFERMAAAVGRRQHERLELLSRVAASMSKPFDSIVRVVGTLDPTKSSEAPVLTLELLRLRRLLDEYVDAARIEEGVLEFKSEPVDLGPLVAEAVELFRPLSPTHVFSLPSTTRSVCVRGDRLRLGQAVNHLLFVAIRHAVLGGRIALDLHLDGVWDTLSIEASPTGSGSFEHLFNASHGLETSFLGVPGSGFTIHTARRVVEWHGGTLEVRAERNAIVVFTVRLPCLQSEQGAMAR